MKNILSVVPTNVSYNYTTLQNNINDFKNTYSFLKFGNIGYSVLGKKIPYIKIGNGKKEVLYQASIHANEWITSTLLMKFAQNFSEAVRLNDIIYGEPARYLFERISLYIVPMVNPDGVDLVTGNIDKNSNIYKNYIDIASAYPHIPFPDGWKANFNGVDLNLQFPARMGTSKRN